MRCCPKEKDEEYCPVHMNARGYEEMTREETLALYGLKPEGCED